MLSPAHGVAGVLLVACATSLLAACSAPDNTAYCAALKSADARWATAGASLQNRQAAESFVLTVTKVEESAPSEVKSEWESLRVLFQKFATDQPDLSGLTEEMKDFENSAKRIEAHAKETCGVDLGA